MPGSDPCTSANELYHGLQELLRLSNHYARLLNQYDGGKRKTFASAEAWLKRLKELEKPRPLELNPVEQMQTIANLDDMGIQLAGHGFAKIDNPIK